MVVVAGAMRQRGPSGSLQVNPVAGDTFQSEKFDR